uniref:KICSTOR complex protein ITFG2 isoform X5 n=1 Tax=Pristiophorus japonicus TaxID=55135 RepID=UPI00398E35DE
MRSVSYVERVALDFSGNLFTQAICLGDTDNDGLNELVVGDTNGKLYVYKSDDCKPWITRSCIGMVTCVGVGDICNKGKNFVVAVGAEGWFHIFDLSGISTKSDTSSHHDFLFGDEQKAFFTQHIPANTKVMLISDIDGDGKCEMVVGYTDRVVRAFRWEDSSIDSSGQLVLLKKWLLEGQVDSLTVNPGPDGTPELMVSQPGCGYAVLLCTWRLDQERAPKRDPSGTSNSEGLIRDVILHQTSGRIHNKNVSTHLIGSINRGSCDDSSKSGLFALCTLDGMYACKDGRNSPCLVYVSFNHKIYVYWRVELERMESTNILKVLETDEFRYLLQGTSVDASNSSAVQAMLHQTLYFPDQLEATATKRINSTNYAKLELSDQP